MREELIGKPCEVVKEGPWYWAVVGGKKVGRTTDRKASLKIANEVSMMGYTTAESNV